MVHEDSISDKSSPSSFQLSAFPTFTTPISHNFHYYNNFLTTTTHQSSLKKKILLDQADSILRNKSQPGSHLTTHIDIGLTGSQSSTPLQKSPGKPTYNTSAEVFKRLFYNISLELYIYLIYNYIQLLYKTLIYNLYTTLHQDSQMKASFFFCISQLPSFLLVIST